MHAKNSDTLGSRIEIKVTNADAQENPDDKEVHKCLQFRHLKCRAFRHSYNLKKLYSCESKWNNWRNVEL